MIVFYDNLFICDQWKDMFYLYANYLSEKEQCRAPGQKKTCCVNILYFVLVPNFS